MASSSRDTNKVCCYAHPDAPLIEDYRAGDMICSECGLVVGDRVIDVGSEWRTFSNEKSGVDPSRVGGPENPLLSGGDLSTIIGPGTGSASFDAFGSPKYQNRRTMSSSDRSLILAFKIQLPKFGGAYADWPNFFSLFSTIVDSSAELSDLEKFHHLRSSLTGAALDTISSLELNERNYMEATHIKAIFSLKAVEVSPAIGLRQLSDKFNSHTASHADDCQ
ncbi:transcription initiation factor IIB [Stomoxys calcitrans]|uniref:transcription initiation factor IIB n=1 Tax=Stomoxys calcitrans TaxID=35570 RepID=UPI0027E2FCC7|nr:transcription initiation factor IIB [Stomoxys calcitrans]